MKVTQFKNISACHNKQQLTYSSQ